MVFTSWAFVRFFLVVLIGLSVMRTRTLRQLVLLVASAFFYGYWNVWYLPLLATPALIDYYCALRIDATEDPLLRKRWLLVSLVTNLGLLGYFKYAAFFATNIAALLGRPIPHLDILLPVGISFYTFKTLSYTIDVYRRDIPVCRKVWQYTMFVMYFPELVAGPIVRASVFLPQMRRSLRPSWPRAIVGLQVVLLGVTKKLLIADRLAVLVDPVFAAPRAYSQATVASALVAYSLQIYCDFSGYSDIAIGISRIIGFDLPENFNMPYLATSITDFWRRWHMTLSAWLRDYLYIPLGGNRRGRIRTYVNLTLTMLLGGLWHGANWTFVGWGLLHGIGLAVHKALAPRLAWWTHWTRAIAGWLVTYAFVCLAWVFFRATTFADALIVLRKIAGLEPGGVQWHYSPLFMLLPLVVLAHAIGAYVAFRERNYATAGGKVPPPPLLRGVYERARSRFAVRPHRAAGVYALLPVGTFAGALILTIWMVGLFLLASTRTSPFIYFRF